MMDETAVIGRKNKVIAAMAFMVLESLIISAESCVVAVLKARLNA